MPFKKNLYGRALFLILVMAPLAVLSSVIEEKKKHKKYKKES